MPEKSELEYHEDELRASPNQWRWKTAQVIRAVPRGRLATYGTVADCANATHGLNIGARNVAWLRQKLYELLGHETRVPLHRVAKAGDVGSLADSAETKAWNDALRQKEGTLANPDWITAKELGFGG